MAFLSSLGKFAGATILTLSLVALVMASVLAGVTAKDSMQPVVVDLISQQVSSQMSAADLADAKQNLDELCAREGGGIVTQPAEIGGENISLAINCTEISTMPASGIPSLFGEAFFENLYYRQYSCSFLDCITQTKSPERFTVLLSAQANSFFNSLVPFAIACALIGIIIIVVAARRPQSILKTAGKAVLSAGIPYFILLVIKGVMPVPTKPPGLAEFVTGIFESMSSMFLMLLVTGIAMVVAGLVWSKTSPEKEGPSKKRKKGM